MSINSKENPILTPQRAFPDARLGFTPTRRFPRRRESLSVRLFPFREVTPNSEIRLSEAFFNEIIRHPVPIDMNTLTALKRCALDLDLYLWINYRTFALRAPLRLTWRQVYRQFGPNPDEHSHDAIQNFRRRVLRELKKIKLAWPSLNYATDRGLLILHPSPPTIAADAHLDRRRRQSRAGVHPGAGTDRLEPEPDRPLGQCPQGERRGGGGDRASGRDQEGTRHFGRPG